MVHPGPLQPLLLEANREVYQQSSCRALRLWELDLHFFICETEPALLELSEIQQERCGRCEHSTCHMLCPRLQRLFTQEPNGDRASAPLQTSLSRQDTGFLIKVFHLERKKNLLLGGDKPR